MLGINKLGVGVAMNNTIPATPSNTAVNQTNTNVNNIQLDDVQKLQQQLQDIKEQASEFDGIFGFVFSSINFTWHFFSILDNVSGLF